MNMGRMKIQVPGPLQTVQRAEPWGCILSIQAFVLVVGGIDNVKRLQFRFNFLDGLEWFKTTAIAYRWGIHRIHSMHFG